MEEQVRRHGRYRALSAPPVGTGKCPSQEACCGLEPRQADASGCDKKKAVRPAVKKHLVQHMIVAYHVSVKRACRTLPTPRSSLYYKAHKRDETLLASECARLRTLESVTDSDASKSC